MHDEQPWNAARRNMPETKRNIQDYHRKLVYIISKQKISEITIRRFASSSFFLSTQSVDVTGIEPFSHYSSLQHVSQLASSSPTYRFGKGSLCKTRSETICERSRCEDEASYARRQVQRFTDDDETCFQERRNHKACIDSPHADNWCKCVACLCSFP